MLIEDKKYLCNLEDCDGGQTCYEDNGETKHCKKCLCRFCSRGKCPPALKNSGVN